MQHQQSFARERDELGWYYAGIGPTVGLRAAPMERGGASGIFDDHASRAAHMRRREKGHRKSVERLAIVDATLTLLPYETRADLAAAFTPFGAARASHRAQSAFADEGQPLFGIALRTEAARALAGEDPSTAQVMLVLEDGVARLPRGVIEHGHRLSAVLSQARLRFRAAMAAYAAARTVCAPRSESARERMERQLDELVAHESGVRVAS